MSWLVLPLLCALAALLVVVVVLAGTPVKLTLSARTDPQYRVRITARGIGGMMPSILVYDSTRAKRERKSKPERKRRKPSRRSQGLRLVRAVPRLVIDLLRPIRLERLDVDADVGLEDPADTGMLFGLLQPLRHLPPLSKASIAVRPDFTRSVASGSVDAGISFVPAAFIPPGARFVWTLFGPSR